MAASNAGQIDHAQPGPIDELVLTQQVDHRSEAIWNGQVKHNTTDLTNVHALVVIYQFMVLFCAGFKVPYLLLS